MTKFYRVYSYQPSGERYGSRHNTLRDAAERVLKGIDPDPDEIKRFDSEDDAVEYAKKLRCSIDSVACTWGYVLHVTWHMVDEIVLDEEGDEIDSICLGGWDCPSVEDILNAIDPEDEDENEEDEDE